MADCLDGGPEMAPKPPTVRSVPAKPCRPSRPRDTPKAHTSGLGGLDVPRAFRARTVAGDVFAHGGLVHASLQPQTERSLDDGAAAEARRTPRSLHGAIELVWHADRDLRRRLGHAFLRRGMTG